MVAYVDPKSKKQNGIVCDLCGSVCTNKFTYFSAQFDKVYVDVALGKVQVAHKDMLGISDVDFLHLSLDICGKCMDGLINKVKTQIVNRDKSQTDKPQGGGAWTAKAT